MTPGRAAAYIGGGVLLAAWLSSAATSPQEPEARPAPQPEATSGTETLASDVQAQAGRLRTRLAAAPTPQAPTRNPFAFAVREMPRVRPAPRPAESEPILATAPAVSEPELSLVGVAEEQSARGQVRTAMIVGAGDELFMVTEGQELAGGRYRVSAIGADAVELKDLTSGAVRRLGLQ